MVVVVICGFTATAENILDVSFFFICFFSSDIFPKKSLVDWSRLSFTRSELNANKLYWPRAKHMLRYNALEYFP